MKVKKFENLGNKIGLKISKWSNLNAPGTEKEEANLLDFGVTRDGRL